MTSLCTVTAGLPCWLEVDLDAIAHNVTALAAWVTPGAAVAAVIKADGYGVGAEAVGRAALAAGAAWLAVARVHEGVALRAAGLQAPILVLNRVDPSECAEALVHDLTLTIDSGETGAALARLAALHQRRAGVHIKVDTGLHRFGVTPDAALDLANELGQLHPLDLQGLYTHFASADDPDPAFTQEQFARFLATRERLAMAGHYFPVCHSANSAATITYRDSHLDLVRVGLLLYGVSPTESLPPGLVLQPALALRGRLARVSDVAPGDGVGYGQIWKADGPTRVGLVTAGYADGIDRRLSNQGTVLVDGAPAPIIGRVSMDQTTIDISAIPLAQVGDTVTFFGAERGNAYSLWQFAHDADTIAHEALTGIGGRVARVYHRRGEVTSTARLSGSACALAPI